MKKRISIILVLSMILTVMVPMGVLAEGDSNQELFDAIYSSRIGVALRSTNVTSETVINIVNGLEGQGYVDGFITDTFKVINGKRELANFLEDTYKIEESVVKNLASELTIWWNKANEDDLKSIIEKLKASPKEELEENDIKTINSLRRVFSTNFSEPIEAINTAIGSKSRMDLASDLAKAILDNTVVKENENKVPCFSFNKDGLNKAIKGIEDNYLIDENHKITKLDKQGVYETINEFVPVLNSYYKNVENVLKENDFSDQMIITALKMLVGSYEEYNIPSDPGTDEPSTPGTGGGGGGAPSSGGDSGGAAPTPGKVEEGTEVVMGELGKDEIKTTEKDGVTTVEVKEDKALATIQAIAKKADGKEAVLVIRAEKVDSANLVVSLPGSVVLELKDKNINLEIVSNGIECSIPFNAISTVNIDKKAKVEFKSEEVKEDVASELAKDIGEVNNTIELYIEITKGDKVIKVTNFNTPIEVRINVKGKGNYEKLAVYYLNEADNSLEFVSGHIVNDNIILKLNHLSKYVIVESTKTFTDIADHWAKDYVESMVAKNIINGYEDDTFKPEGKITRAEFVKMVVSAIDVELVDYKEGFNDVKTSDWHADYIATAKELDLIGGYTDGSFRPNATIKRAEMAVILGKVIDEKVEEKDIEALNTKFNDYEDIPEWALESVAKVVKAGLMNGTEKNEFCPNSDTTRAQGATTIYRLYN